MKPPVINANKVAIFLDFDGTLVDIAPTPDLVEVTPELSDLLELLQRSTEGAIALITGRSLESLRSVLKLPIESVGCHGAEWHINDSGFISRSTCVFDRQQLNEIRDSLIVFASEHKLLLESKTHAVTVHFRGAEHLETTIDQWLDDHAEQLTGLRVIRGKCVREIQLTGINKGIAIELLMTRPAFSGRIPIFVGDDVTDEDAFRWINSVDGISIKVGKGETEANFYLDDIGAVHQWLHATLNHRDDDT